jgi:dUTP pyrophosphatase
LSSGALADSPVISFLRLRGDQDADLPLPRYMTSGAAGMDVVANLDSPVALDPGERVLIPTGLAMEIPAGYEVQVRPRSGLAAKYGVTVANAPGTIDSDFRGEVHVILINLGAKSHEIQRGDRVAQLVVAPVLQAQVQEVRSLQNTKRGAGGFGHTGNA